MNLLDFKNVEDKDLSLYFNGALLIDPHTGTPAVLSEIYKNKTVVLNTAGGAVCYEGDKSLPFYDLTSYKSAKLGYKYTGASNVPVLYGRTFSNGGTGSRVLTSRTLYKKFPAYLLYNSRMLDLYDAYLTRQKAVSNNWLPDIVAAIFAPTVSVSFWDAVAAADKNLSGAAIINSSCVLQKIHPKSADYYLIFRESVIAKLVRDGQKFSCGEQDKEAVTALLGEVDGILFA